MATFAFAGVVQELGTDEGDTWNCPTPVNGTYDLTTNDGQACNARDLAFQAVNSLPIFLIIAIVAWMFLTVTRRDFGEA